MWGNKYEPYFNKEKYIPIDMTVEEVDKIIDEEEILYITKATSLNEVFEIKLPGKSYTLINSTDLSRCYNLRELDLSGNLLTEFSRSINLPNLKVLDISQNNFSQKPLVEQFPNLIVLVVDHNMKLNMNTDAVAYFCPNLKIINGEKFEVTVPDHFMNYITNASRALETIIRNKWENEIAERCYDILDNDHRRALIDEMVRQLKDRNLLIDEHLSKYRDLLIFKLTEKYLESKLYEAEDELLVPVTIPSKRLQWFFTEIKDSERKDEELLKRFVNVYEEDELAALLELRNEIVGNNIENANSQLILTTTDSGGNPQQFLIEQPGSNINFYQSLIQNKGVVMTVFNAKLVKGRPTAEFLPGELRNKDYVKGDMASNIYQKTVKEVLGQKGLPKKLFDKLGDNCLIRCNSSHPLAQINNSNNSNINSKKRGRPNKQIGDIPKPDPIQISMANNKIPPRPKMRRRNGELRSLKDVNKANGSISNQLDYDPLHFIRCHAKDSAPNDQETKVWRCAFAPSTKVPGTTTHFVATCGGEVVCVIDCDCGKVVNRYKREGEDFIALAWTSLEIEPGLFINLLAAGGKSKEIRLFFSDRESFLDLKGHPEDVSSLIFHPSVPQILFSGDAKASIFVWDIGMPSKHQTSLVRFQMLMRLRCPRPDLNPVMNLVFLDHYSYLIAGCDDAMFAWKITDFKGDKKEREPDMELRFTESNKAGIPIDSISYDGLAQIGRTALVFRVVDNQNFFVIDFGTILERRKGLQKTIPIETCGTLDWLRSDDFYINISSRNNLGAVLSGDSMGRIWIYDLDPYIEENPEKVTNGFHCLPCRVLDWPECNIGGPTDENSPKLPVINTVDMSSDGLFVVGVTDNNLVCIWKLAKDEIPN